MRKPLLPLLTLIPSQARAWRARVQAKRAEVEAEREQERAFGQASILLDALRSLALLGDDERRRGAESRAVWNALNRLVNASRAYTTLQEVLGAFALAKGGQEVDLRALADNALQAVHGMVGDYNAVLCVYTVLRGSSHTISPLSGQLSKVKRERARRLISALLENMVPTEQALNLNVVGGVLHRLSLMSTCTFSRGSSVDQVDRWSLFVLTTLGIEPPKWLTALTFSSEG